MFLALYGGIVALVLVLLGWFASLPEEAVKNYIVENGPIETLSAIGWFVAASFTLWTVRRTAWRDGYVGALILLLAGLRELDFQKRFTTGNATKIKFYFDPQVPLVEKALVICLFIPLLLATGWFLKRNLPLFIAQIRRRVPPARALLGFFPLLLASKVLDRLPDIMKDFGISLSSGSATTLRAFEEVIELGLPLFMLVIVYHYSRLSAAEAVSEARVGDLDVPGGHPGYDHDEEKTEKKSQVG